MSPNTNEIKQCESLQNNLDRRMHETAAELNRVTMLKLMTSAADRDQNVALSDKQTIPYGAGVIQA